MAKNNNADIREFSKAIIDMQTRHLTQNQAVSFKELSERLNDFLPKQLALTNPKNVLTHRDNLMGDPISLGFASNKPARGLENFTVFQKDAKGQYKPIPLPEIIKNTQPAMDASHLTEILVYGMRQGKVAVSQYGREFPARLRMDATGKILSLEGLGKPNFTDMKKPKLTIMQRIKRVFNRLPEAEAATHDANKLAYAMGQYARNHSLAITASASSRAESAPLTLGDGMGRVFAKDQTNLSKLVGKITELHNEQTAVSKPVNVDKEPVEAVKVAPKPALTPALIAKHSNNEALGLLNFALKPDALDSIQGQIRQYAALAIMDAMGYKESQRVNAKIELPRTQADIAANKPTEYKSVMQYQKDPAFEPRMKELMKTQPFEALFSGGKLKLQADLINGELFDKFMHNYTNATFNKGTLSQKEATNLLDNCRSPQLLAAESAAKTGAKSNAVVANAKAEIKPNAVVAEAIPKAQPKPQPKPPMR